MRRECDGWILQDVRTSLTKPKSTSQGPKKPNVRLTVNVELIDALVLDDKLWIYVLGVVENKLPERTA